MRRWLVGLIVVTLMGAVSTWALASDFPNAPDYEGGHRSCSGSSHVYTKGKWKNNYGSWLDVTADGIREKKLVLNPQDGVWRITYLNTWSTGSIDAGIDSAYYEIAGNPLSYTWSWPGCEAD